ncbi:MAG TPA: YtxH domain-containing protein [Cyclobacteriaceae bacterium]
MNTKTKVIGGFLLGAAIGAVTGLLLAPSSGKKTRKKIKNESKLMADEVITKANESLKSAKKAFDQKLETFMKKGKSAVDPNQSEVMNGN